MPDLLVIDGGKPQVRTVIRVFAKLNLNVPVIGIAKNPDRIVVGISETQMPTIRISLRNPGFNLIRLLRDEAHRFSKKYHVELRTRKMFEVG